MNPLTHYNQNTPGALLLLGVTLASAFLAGRAFLAVPRQWIAFLFWLILALVFGAATWFWCTFRIRLF